MRIETCVDSILLYQLSEYIFLFLLDLKGLLAHYAVRSLKSTAEVVSKNRAHLFHKVGYFFEQNGMHSVFSLLFLMARCTFFKRNGRGKDPTEMHYKEKIKKKQKQK